MRFASRGQPRDLYTQHLRRQDATRRVPEDPLLFVPTSLIRMFDQDLTRAGIPKKAIGGKLDFHALRVAYIKLVLESDADAKDAQTLARHATPEMTLGIYGRTREGRLEAIIEHVGARLRSAPASAHSVHSAAIDECTNPVNAENIATYSHVETYGAAGDRTPDLMTASHALSHLSYSPSPCWRTPRVQEP